VHPFAAKRRVPTIRGEEDDASVTSPIFIFVYVPLAVVGVAALRRAGAPRATLAWLVAVSVVFSAVSDARSVLPLVVSTVFNYALGAALVRARSARRALRKPLLVLGVAANLALLAYHKYGPPLLDLLSSRHGSPAAAASGGMPLGISFLTFLKVAFLVDLYEERTCLRGLADYCLFVTFFPKLIAGPIVRHQAFSEEVSGLASGRLSRTDLRRRCHSHRARSLQEAGAGRRSGSPRQPRLRHRHGRRPAQPGRGLGRHSGLHLPGVLRLL